MKFGRRGFLAVILAFALDYMVAPQAAYPHDEKAARIAADNQPEIFKNIGIAQKLGTKLPLETTFRDQTGASVSLQGLTFVAESAKGRRNRVGTVRISPAT